MGQTGHDGRAARSSLVEEMATAGLGDQRLDERRDQLMSALEQHPDAAFPDACADDAEVEALYRFLRNKRVSLPAILEPHVVATQARCAAAGEVLVLHDTTDMVFGGETARAGLTPLGKARHGFWVHVSLAVSVDERRVPLGIISLLPFVRRLRPPGTATNYLERFADPDKESRYWAAGVAAVRGRGPEAITAIHVMDRAGDSYELFAELVAHRDRFVIRLTHDRRVVREDGTGGTLAEACRCLDVLGERQVVLAARRDGNRPQTLLKRFPPREGRGATLRCAAQRVEIERPPHVSRSRPAALAVHVVSVWEVNAPAGTDPVEWRLITTEPIDSVEQVWRIVDWYRARWMIEEFFKALKTGCAYEKRQLASLHTLLIALALLTPIAWQLLVLRHLARAAPAVPATAVLSPRQLQVLRAVPAGAALGAAPTVMHTLRAVARLGGHLRHNGDPGWLVLGRGMQKLLVMEAGWAAAKHARCDQS